MAGEQRAGHRVAAILARGAGSSGGALGSCLPGRGGSTAQRPLGSEAVLLEGLRRRPLGEWGRAADARFTAVDARLHPGACLSPLLTLLGAMGGHISSPTTLCSPVLRWADRPRGWAPHRSQALLAGRDSGE